VTIFFYLLLVKHAIADLWMQGRLNKPKFGDKNNFKHPKLWIHCGDHAVLTFAVALLFTGVVNALLFALLDFVLHFAIDYTKNQYVLRTNLSTKNHTFWKVQAIDQILHYTIYLAIVLLAA